jgi:hypothetical protein
LTSDVEPSPRIGDLRAEFFRTSGFGADGGESAKWVRYPVWGIPIVVPNVDARRRALRLHDLHHLATGYDTSWTGESEIAAWELGAGCHGYAAAWALNVAAFSIGVVIAPRRLWRAFVRGRSSRTLYRHHWTDEYLAWRLSEMREFLGLSGSTKPPTLGDRALFLVWALPVFGVAAAVVAGAMALV